MTGLSLDYVTRLAIFSILPLLRRDLHLTDVVIGLLATSFLWPYGLLSPIAGFVGDRFSRRTVIIASLSIWSVVMALGSMVGAAWQLVLLRVALAVAQVPYMPTGNGLLADFHGPDTLGKASGFYQAGCYIGILAAGLPVAYISTHWGWRTMHLLIGGLGILLAVLMFAYLPERAPMTTGSVPDPADTISAREAASLLRIPTFLVIMAGFMLASVVFWVVFTYLPLMIYETYHVSLERAALQATIYIQVAGLVANPVLGACVDARAKGNARKRFLAATAISSLGLPALLIVGLAKNASLFVAGLLLLGVVMGGFDISWLPMLCTVTAKNQRATAWGVLNFGATIGGGAAAFLTGLIMREIGLSTVMVAIAPLFVLIGVLFTVSIYKFLPRDLMTAEKQLESG